MAAATNWSPPPAVPRLGDNDVHLWRAFLDRGDFRDAETVLGEDERLRASRFVFPRDRNRFIAARDILRAILGRYTGRSAAAMEFQYEPEGKPRLRLHESDPPIRFNVSHSQDLAVYALTRRREIGVDVEAIRSNIPVAQLAEQVFSATELAELRALPCERQEEAFFLCWTRKEAYVKARGAGLGMPLDSFSVSLTPEQPEVLTGADSARWTFRSFRPADGYAGAIVAEGKDWRLQLWDWDVVRD